VLREITSEQQASAVAAKWAWTLKRTPDLTSAAITEKINVKSPCVLLPRRPDAESFRLEVAVYDELDQCFESIPVRGWREFFYRCKRSPRIAACEILCLMNGWPALDGFQGAGY